MTEVSATAAATPLDLARSTPGEYLRRLREEKGLTHAAVGSALHLTVHYIKALESDEYGKLPGLTFVKGYLRSYARFLGADVDNVLARFDEHIAGLLDAGMHTARVERSRRRQDQALRWAIGAGFVVVAGLGAGWWFMRDAEAPAPAAAQRNVPQVETVATPPPAVAAAPAATAVPPDAGAFVPVQSTTTYVPAFQTPAPAPALPLQDLESGLMAGGESAGTAMDDAAAPVNTAAATVVTEEAAAGLAEAGAALEAGPGDQAAAPALAMADTGAPAPGAATTTAIPPAAAGARQVALIGAGNDELRVSFKGSSWIEVDDGNKVRLYNDMLAAGDTLTIRGVAPFRVLLGDAARVDVTFNARPVDFSTEIRADSTARLVLGAPPVTGEGTP